MGTDYMDQFLDGLFNMTNNYKNQSLYINMKTKVKITQVTQAGLFCMKSTFINTNKI